MAPRALLPKIEEKLRPYLLDGRASFELAQKVSRYYQLEDELSMASVRHDETLGGCPVIDAESVLASDAEYEVTQLRERRGGSY